MEKLIGLITIVMVIMLSSCADEEEEVYNTLTCNYDSIISNEPQIAIYTFDGNEMISIFVNDEEIQDKVFWNDTISELYDDDIQVYLDEMITWYTQNELFEGSTCVYSLPIE